jgi:hypothetical protein
MNARRKSRRIHPLNSPIRTTHGRDHPAVRALERHAAARDACVCREIEWPRLGNRAIEQEWFSAIDQRVWSFSGFAYTFISFDLVLSEWLPGAQAGLDPFEEDFLHELPRLRTLLDECESAAKASANDRVLPLISKAREFLDAFEQSIIARVGPVVINPVDRPVVSLWGAGKHRE